MRQTKPRDTVAGVTWLEEPRVTPEQEQAIESRRWAEAEPAAGGIVCLVGLLADADVAREQLVDRSGLSRSSVWRILHGQVRPLAASRDALLAAARDLGAAVDDDHAAIAFDVIGSADVRRRAEAWLAAWPRNGSGRPAALAETFARHNPARPFAACQLQRPDEEMPMLPEECIRWWGLRRSPWGPPESDGTGLYESKSFQDAKALLVAAAEAQDFAFVAGAIGSGKTLLAASVLDQLSRRPRFEGAVCHLRTLSREGATARHVLEALALDLGDSDTGPARSNEVLTRQVIDILVGLQTNMPQRCPLLVIDEAQALSKDAFRAIKRVREAASVGYAPGLGVILVGQSGPGVKPDLADRLKASDLREVHDRAMQIHLAGMDRGELGHYLAGKLRRAAREGESVAQGDVFDKGAVDAIYKAASLPLRVDRIADRAMLDAWRDKQRPVTGEYVQATA